MENIRDHLYIAALLHDIGKFYQRADTGSVEASKFLSEISKMESVFLPFNNGIYSHKHCLWTAQFIEDHKIVFKNLIGENFSDLSNENNLYSLAACHHLKSNKLSVFGEIIKEANCLSSGMDRELEEALRDDLFEQNRDLFVKKRMISILETIHPPGLNGVKRSLPVSKISLSKDYFPRDQFEESPDYEQLWNDFINEFGLIKANDFSAFSETFLNLLYKYTACIPASSVNFSDVSLYDHLKTTAALAVCLYDYRNDTSTVSTVKDRPFLLIGADISGIQSYMYQIVSKYAGKNLKGRSFFLRMLSDAVVRYLIKALNLFQANIVYNSGGSFYLIAPNTPFVNEKLKEATHYIEEKFFAAFGTSLFVAIDSVCFSKNAMMHKEDSDSLGIIWQRLFEKRDKKKSRKFADMIEKGYDKFFEPLMQGGEALRDGITGEEFLLNDEKVAFETYFIKQSTDKQIALGKCLRDTEIMIVSEHPLTCWHDKFTINPADLGFHYYFANKNDMTQSVDNVSIIHFNNTEFCKPVCGNNNTYEFQFYGGNEYNGQTFEEMTENQHLSRLGVLRMDVDNLGYVFQSGILPKKAALSRFAALSRSFDYFFSGYLNTIWKETAPERSSIIYSGGDDLLIVGSWDTVIELAKKIYRDFREFTCYNPNFGISGGIAIIPSKYPIMKGADESADEEKAAKNHTVKGLGLSKNSISFMDFPMNWDMEFPVVESLKNELVTVGNKTLLSKIMAHAANAGIKANKITNIKTYWMLTYDLSRLKERARDGNLKTLIDNCITEVCGNKSSLNSRFLKTAYHSLELWAFAARWAELEIRKDR